jgi:thiamine-phosphate pyrophosphorylase
VTRPGLERVQGVYALADDDPRWRNDVRAQLAGALAGGATVVQLRLKHLGDGAALALARESVARSREAGALLLVNDRFDLALLSGADGVHLGQDDLAPERIPADARARLLVGLSTHTLEQVRESRTRPADYIAFGPVFGTRSKESEFSPRGIGLLREAVALAGRPLVAIGGISAANAAQVRAAGAAAAAVISAIADASDPAEATRYLRALLLASPPGSV